MNQWSRSRPIFAGLAGLLLALLAACDAQEPARTVANSPPEAAQSAPTPERRVNMVSGLAQGVRAGASLPFGMTLVGPEPTHLHSPGQRLAAVFHHVRPAGDGITSPWDLVLSVPEGDSEQPAQLEEFIPRPGRVTAGVSGQGLVIESVAGHRIVSHRFRLQEPAPLILDISLLGPEADSLSSDIHWGKDGWRMDGALATAGGTGVHFAMDFDQAAERVAVEGRPHTVRLRFDLEEPVLHLRLALSTVDRHAARINLRDSQDVSHDQLDRNSEEAWNRLLGRLEIVGAPQSGARVTTALYRVLSRPGDITDVDGRYRGADGQVHRLVPGDAYFGNLSVETDALTAWPLFSLVAPDQLASVVATLLAHQRTAGTWPGVTAWGQETGTAENYAAAAAVAAALDRGVEKPAPGRALAALVRGVNRSGDDEAWKQYLRYRYFPVDTVPQGAVTRSIKAAFEETAVAQVGLQASEAALADAFATRAVFYRSLYDSASGYFRGRDRRGRWTRPHDNLSNAADHASHYAPVNGQEALWIPGRFDIEGLLGLLGGRGALTARLNDFFHGVVEADTGRLGAYAHWQAGNHHIPWLYAFSNEPERAVLVVRDIMQGFHETLPTGVDATAVFSGWYVFAMLGFYPVSGVTGDFVLSEPLSSEIRIGQGDRSLTILRTGGQQPNRELTEPAAIYFNGNRQPGTVITHQRLRNGGVLEFRRPSASKEATDE